MRAPSARTTSRRVARSKPRKPAEVALIKLEVGLKKTARDIKRSLRRAKEAFAETKDRLEIEARETALEVKRAVADAKKRAQVTKTKLGEEARFLRRWVENPLNAGAVAPSSPELSRAMASFVDPNTQGPVIELGPGTGPVTEALIARGIAPERLVLVEYDRDFCTNLRRRFPESLVVQGDAYDLHGTLGSVLRERAAAFVSSLPLMTKPKAHRVSLLHQAFALAQPGAPFVQFTYSLGAPVPLDTGGFMAMASKRIWRNVPPARVWIYRPAPM